jgi:UPF0716 protein FxsA
MTMLALIGIVLILFAALELYIIVLVAGAIGALNTVGLILLFAIAGAWLAKHEGLWVLTRIRQQLDQGNMPTNELIDAGLVLAGGLLLIVPGFITDAFGLLLLFPPTRAVARAIVKRRFGIRVYGYGINQQLPRRDDGYDGPDDIIDV